MSRRVKFYLGMLVLLVLLAAGIGAFFVHATRVAGARRARLESQYGGAAMAAELIVRDASRIKTENPVKVRPVQGTAPSVTFTGNRDRDKQRPALAPAPGERRRVRIFEEIESLCLASQMTRLYRLDLGGIDYRWIRLDADAGNDPYYATAADREKMRAMVHKNWKNFATPVEDPHWMQQNVDFLNERQLTELLDRLEELLLDCEWTLPDYMDYKPYYSSSFQRLMLFTVARALARGDGERAARLLARGIEFFKAQYLYHYPAPPYTEQGLPLSIALTGGCAEFPAWGLEDARRIMETPRITPAQRAELRKAHALRWAREQGQGPHFSHKQNFIHFISIREISPDQLALALVWPKFRHAIDDYAAAWEADDNAGTERAIAGMERYRTLANLDPGSIRSEMERIDNMRYDDGWNDPALILLMLKDALALRAGEKVELIITDGEWRLERVAGPGEARPELGAGGPDALTMLYRIQRQRRFEWNGKTLYKPCGKRWDRDCEELLRTGWKATGTMRNAQIHIVPRQHWTWRNLMEAFRIIDRERGGVKPVTTDENGDAKKIKNLSNQTTTPALKK